MKRSELKELIERYLRGNLSEQEFHFLQNYLREHDSDDELIELWDDLLVSESEKVLSEPASDVLFSNILSDSRIKAPQHRFLSKKRMLVLAASVAAASVLLFFGVNLGKSPSESNAEQPQSATVILPGGNKARLELDDGTIVDLEEMGTDSLILFEGFSIRKAANGSLEYIARHSSKEPSRYNTLVTPAGGEYTLVLPDGSEVTLNASSRLRYPVRFGQDLREVELSGEAYFDVARQMVDGKTVPFIVKTGEQKLEVLGTQFNIRNYGEKIETTLVEGAVKLTYPGTESYFLKPNQQSVYQTNGQSIQIASVDPFYITAWKNGSFAFSDAGIREVMEEVARWYDVEVDYSENIEDIKFSGTISKFEDIEKLLNTIAMTGTVDFDIKGRRIIVRK